MNGTTATPSMIGMDLLEKRHNFPFLLLLAAMVFSSFRPDRLLPGGRVLTYFPDLIILILGLCWLLTSNKVLYNRQTKYILLFGLLIMIQVPFARNRALTFSAFKSFTLFIITGYLFSVQYIDSVFKWEKFVRLSILLSPFVAIVGILHKGVIKIPALQDENDFALLMNTLVPVAFFLGQEAESSGKKVLYYGCALLFTIGTVVSFSRGGFVGLIVVGIYLLWKTPHRVTGLLLVFGLALAIYANAPKGYWHEVETIDTQNYEAGTGKERVESWKAGWKMFLNHPITGVGANNFGIYLPDYYAYNPDKMWGRVAHSFYFTLIPEMGLIGTLLVLGILWNNRKDHQFIVKMEKEKQQILEKVSMLPEEKKKLARSIRTLYYFSLGFNGAMIAFLVTGAFLSVLWYGDFWNITAFTVITGNIVRKINEKINLASQETT